MRNIFFLEMDGHRYMFIKPSQWSWKIKREFIWKELKILRALFKVTKDTDFFAVLRPGMNPYWVQKRQFLKPLWLNGYRANILR